MDKWTLFPIIHISSQEKDFLQNPSSLYKLKDYCYYCNYKQDMNNPSGAVTNKPYCPGNNQNNCDDVK